MTTKSRRRILKGLGLTLPAVWARPVVEAVVLPAHAQTSAPGTGTPVTCGVPEGCYIFEGGSFSWPGGTGPFFDVPFYDNSECFGTSIGTASVVVAESEAEAATALTCTAPDEIPTDPAPPGGCNFFGCG